MGTCESVRKVKNKLRNVETSDLRDILVVLHKEEGDVPNEKIIQQLTLTL